MVRGTGLVVFVLALGCAGSGQPADVEDELEDVEAQLEVGAIPKLATDKPGLGSGWIPPSRVAVVNSTNMTIIVDDPRKALARAKKTIGEIGATVQHANAQAESANLNAQISPARHTLLRNALARLGEIRDENTSRNDMRTHVAQLTRRHARLQAGERAIHHLMRSSEDQGLFDALTLQLELSTRERDNLRNQIDSYAQQSEYSNVNVTFMRKP